MARKPRKRIDSQIPEEIRVLTQQVGNFIEFWGFKRIHGELWLHLFLSREPLDAGDLIARLEISKSLISLCLAELLQYKVIRETGKSDAGTILYDANPDVPGVISHVLRVREKAMLDQIASVALKASRLSLEAQEKAHLRSDRIQYVNEIAQEAAALLDLFTSTDEDSGFEPMALLNRLNNSRPAEARAEPSSAS